MDRKHQANRAAGGAPGKQKILSRRGGEGQESEGLRGFRA